MQDTQVFSPHVTFHHHRPPCPGPDPGLGLPLSTDLVPQDKVSDEPKREEEDGEHDEVQVEFGVQHVQLLQDGLRLLEVTCLVFIAVKILSVQTIDGQDDALETISETQGMRKRNVVT